MPGNLLAIVLVVLGAPVWASPWQVDRGDSRIGFVASYDGIEFEGWFENWTAAIEFEPSGQPAGNMRISIRMGSVNSRSKDRDNGMRGKDWFWVARFPQAVFTATTFAKATAGRYVADGHLAIRERRQALHAPFTWTLSGDGRADLRGAVVVDRRRFDLGTGEWADDPIIGFSVTILYRLVLRPVEAQSRE
ncbi:MAG: hypothetical protein GKR94_02510 [Gammaproteobacteria bacterium]|nr:hypothetical protein [Gammaproteobacteria bacterium]